MSIGMSSDEQLIYQYLKTMGEEFVNAKEVSRRAGTKQRYHEEPDWAKPLMVSMAERGILESNPRGLFRLKPEGKAKHKQRWVSPDIEQILNEKGVAIEDAESEPATDEPSEPL